VDVPKFEGNLNPNDFVDWLGCTKPNEFFDFKSYLDEKGCKVVVLKLTKYASLWWENLKHQ